MPCRIYVTNLDKAKLPICKISVTTFGKAKLPNDILVSANKMLSEAISLAYSKLGIHDKYPNIDSKALYIWALNEVVISFMHKGCCPVHLDVCPEKAIYDMDQEEMYVMIFELIRNNMDLLDNPEIPVK